MDFEILRGKCVINARYDGDSIHLNLLGNKYISLVPYGDCCSHCFIQNVSGSEALVDAAILSVEDLECVASEQEENEHEAVNAWGHRIVTNKGICSIEMRVYHNGYYGGSLDPSMHDGQSNAKVLEDF